MKSPRRLPSFFLRAFVPWWLIFVVAIAGCAPKTQTPPPASNRVVLYCSVDEVYARPIIKKLEAQTGLRIDALFDVEAAKTAGLANRIRAESARPRGDVFWSSALLQTLLLGREGLLQPHQSPSARGVPAAFKDRRGLWTGLGVRARVLVFHKSVNNPPRTLQGLLQRRFINKVGISNPQFGTASDWAAALAVRWGVPQTLDYFRALKQNGARVLPGNSVVADRVARGELLAGVTDVDDYLAQARKTGALVAVAPDVRSSSSGAVLVPGSVAVLRNAPHAAAARRLADALLRQDTELLLAARMEGVMPLQPPASKSEAKSAALSAQGRDTLSRRVPDDTARWPAAWDKVREPLAEILLAP